MTLTKAELADLLFEKVGFNKREAKDMVESFFEEIRSCLEKMPSPWEIRVCQPYGPPFWIDTTTPPAVAWMGVPVDAPRSMPVWQDR